MSSSRAAIVREGVFERFGDEGTSVCQEDLSELQSDQAGWSGASHLLQEPETQTKARIELGATVQKRATMDSAATVRESLLRLREIEDFVGHEQRQDLEELA